MKILLALDDSTATMDEAIRFAGEKKATLTALFVLDGSWNDYTGHDWLSGSGSRADFLEYTEDKELDSKSVAIKEFKKRCSPDCQIISTAGAVSEEIVKELNRGRYDLLIMSYPFRRGLEIVRDSTAEILKRTTSSLYLVRER